MSYKTIKSSTLTNIGNAIRSKNASTKTYRPKDMAAAIRAINKITYIDAVDDYISGDITFIGDYVTTTIQDKWVTGALAARDSLTALILPSVTTFEASCWGMVSLEQVDLSSLKESNNLSFGNCGKLQSVNLNSYSGVFQEGCFSGCYSLLSLTLGANTICNLDGTGLEDTPLTSGRNGYIYVPSSLIEEYRTTYPTLQFETLD